MQAWIFVFAALQFSLLPACKASCCAPPMMRCYWDQAITDLTALTPYLELNNVSMSMDFSHGIVAFNATVRTAFRSGAITESVLCNYSMTPAECYTAVDGQCTKAIVPHAFFQNCLPSGSKYLGNVTFGSELNCSAYEIHSHTASNTTGNYSLTGVVVLAGSSCFPFFEALLISTVPPQGGLNRTNDQAILQIGLNSELLPLTTRLSLPAKNLTSSLDPKDSVFYRILSFREGFNFYTFLTDVMTTHIF
eukprot:m.125367 g.125367  ORF g.125367 m.125367 type:complete len:249 (+) comp37870_c1_seq1:59-805(+)